MTPHEDTTQLYNALKGIMSAFRTDPKDWQKIMYSAIAADKALKDHESKETESSEASSKETI